MGLVQQGYYSFITALLFHRAGTGLTITITSWYSFKKAVIIYEVLVDRAPLTVFVGICESKHALKM